MPGNVVASAVGSGIAHVARLPDRPEDAGVCAATIPGMKRQDYNKQLAQLEVELAKLQAWITEKGLRIVVIFEGRDAAGKGGTIKTITRRLNPRVVRTVALPVPTERQKTEWFLQRYVQHLPAAGEMVLFDRSWYNRLNVEKVMGFCTDEEYDRFLNLCPSFEQTLVDDGITLIKYWLHTSDDEQERRFQARNTDPKRRWKLSMMDLAARSRWVDYSRARDITFEHTNTEWAPWNLASLEDKKAGRLNVITHLLGQIPYEDLTPPPLELPDRQPAGDYVEPDWSGLEIPRVYT
jgi:polyphosphate kinase 2